MSLDCRVDTLVTMLARISFEMRRVFQSIAPLKAVLGHYADHAFSLRSYFSPAVLFAGDTGYVDGKTGFVQRSPRPLGSVHAFAFAAAAALAAFIELALFGRSAKCACYFGFDSCAFHVANSLGQIL